MSLNPVFTQIYSRRRGQKRVLGLGIVSTVLLASACASTDGSSAASNEDGAQGEATTLTVVRPNPSTVNMFNFCSAVGEGYFAEEGIEIHLEALDGVSAVIQSLVSNQADIGVAAAGPVLIAREAARGPEEEPVMFYNHFAKSTYGLVVPEDSDINDPADLRGSTIGVGTADGAEVFFAQSILEDAGLDLDVDFDMLAVGDGGPALAAFERGDIDAYSAAVPDMATLSARGLPVRELTPDKHLAYFGIGFTATQAFIDENEELLEGFSRALTRGVEFGLANKEEAIAHCADLNPEEGANTTVTGPLFDTVAERLQPIDGVDWGVFPEGAWEAWQDSLIQTGDLEGPVDDLGRAYTNSIVAD